MKHPGLMIAAALALSGCAFEVEFEEEFVADEAPTYRAEAQILIIMHEHDREQVYRGSPSGEVGDFTTLTIPMGGIMQEIVTHVFESCFMYGVVFSNTLDPDLIGYVIALEPELRDFRYRYDRVIEDPLAALEEGEEPVAITTPQIEFELALKAYDRAGNTVLDDVYESGLVSGESYIVTNRPAERINEIFHGALQDIMLTVAEDIRPLLVGECEISDFVADDGA